MNALKHGMRARTTVLPGEDAEEYERLTESAYAHYNAGKDFERFLVDRQVNAIWKVRRAERLHDVYMKRAAQAVMATKEEAPRPPSYRSHQDMRGMLVSLNAKLRKDPCKSDDVAERATENVHHRAEAHVPLNPIEDGDLMLAEIFEFASEYLGPQLAMAERYLESSSRHMAKTSARLDTMEHTREQIYKARIRDTIGIPEPTIYSPSCINIPPRLSPVPDPEHSKLADSELVGDHYPSGTVDV